MTVYLDPEISSDKIKVKKVQTQIENTCINDLINEFMIIYDPYYLESAIECDRPYLDIINGIEDTDMYINNDICPWVFRLVFSREKLYSKYLQLKDIQDLLYGTFGDDIFIQFFETDTDDFMMHIRIVLNGEDTVNNEFIQDIFTEVLYSITITGVPGIDKTFISEKPVYTFDESGLVKSTEYIIETDGINIKDTTLIRGVDATRITCNEPQEMCNLFGIEISREVLCYEIKSVITSGSSYINYRHIALLCEIMTSRGYIMSITRHGINKSDAGPLSKCTFEQSVDILLDAARDGSHDSVSGVSENIMLGSIVPSGTGIVEVLLDDKKYEKYYKPKETEFNYLNPLYSFNTN
jgi:DNA-directed RNA polymerase II subunit RPB1